MKIKRKIYLKDDTCKGKETYTNSSSHGNEEESDSSGNDEGPENSDLALSEDCDDGYFELPGYCNASSVSMQNMSD